MEKLRFTPVVVEKAGTVEEILSRAEIGIRKKRKERYELRNIIEEIPEEIKTLYPNIFQEEYRLDFEGPISPQEKRKLFSPGIKGVETLAQRHGFTLPGDLLSRIYVVDEDTYKNVCRQEQGSKEDRSTGTTLPNKVCIINHDEVIRECEEEKMAVDDHLREVGVHELWHSVAYEERWIPTSGMDPEAFSDQELTRRAGIIARRPGKLKSPQNIPGVGLNMLNEGFTQYLTRESHRLAGIKFRTHTYEDELEVVDAVIQVVGEEPFFQAILMKHGFRSLFLAAEKAFGKFAFYQELEERYLAGKFPYTVETFRSMVRKWGRRVVLRYHGHDLYEKYPEESALRHIAGLMREESLKRIGASMSGEKIPKYEGTLRFIKEMSRSRVKKDKTLLLVA